MTRVLLLGLFVASFQILGHSQTVKTSPAAINFGSVAVSGSRTQPEVITNTGRTTVVLTRINARGRNFDASGPALPVSLNPGSSATFHVRFSPKSTGSFSNSLVIGLATGGRGRWRNFDSTAVALSGTGTSTTPPAPTCKAPSTLANGVCTPPAPTCNAPNQLLNGVCTEPPSSCSAPDTLVNGVCTPPKNDGIWTPTVTTSWAWLLSKVPSASNLPTQAIIDSDGVDTPASTVAALHSAGKHWVCYVDVGTWEPGRPDAAQFPASLKGNSVDGFASEKWLDIRQTGILLPIMTQRIQHCADKGADAVEPDDIDGYTNNPGFQFTRADQIAYNKAIAGIVHSFGMSVALKNDGDDVNSLLPFFDFAIVEQCIQFNECATYSPFVTAGKSVLVAEYKGSITSICSQLNALKMNGILTDINLDGQISSCH
jgi:hypothetical protein